MLEILLGIVAIIIALLAIAEVKSSKEEMKEAIESLTAAEGSDEKVAKVVGNALYDKVPETQQLDKIYSGVKTPPDQSARLMQLKGRVDAALYKEKDTDEYFKIMFGMLEEGKEKHIPEEVTVYRLRGMLSSLLQKRRAMSTTYGRGYTPTAHD